MRIEQIRDNQQLASRKSGRAHWFAPDAMRFFRTRLSWQVYSNGPLHYFVTSEKGPNMRRAYSLRLWDENAPDTVETVGEFQGYSTWGAAHRAARRKAWGCK